jgi:hypothetical protein
MVDGDPLSNIASTHKVKRVIANGRVFELDQLVKRGAAPATTPGSLARQQR